MGLAALGGFFLSLHGVYLLVDNAVAFRFRHFSQLLQTVFAADSLKAADKVGQIVGFAFYQLVVWILTRQVNHSAVVVQLGFAVVGLVEIDVSHSQIRHALLVGVDGACGNRLLVVPQRIIVAHLVIGDVAQRIVYLVEILGVLLVFQHFVEHALQLVAVARLAVVDAGLVDACVEGVFVIGILVDNLLIPLAGLAALLVQLV